MDKYPRRRSYSQQAVRKRLAGIAAFLLLLLGVLAACTPRTETVTVEATRVVTETVTVEGEEIVVTRVVTETIVVVPEEETAEEPPSATGSEGDAGPLPPPPDDGPKVREGRGATQAAELALETAVTLRADQTNNNVIESQTIAANSSAIDPTELQKSCQLAAEIYKKRCA